MKCLNLLTECRVNLSDIAVNMWLKRVNHSTKISAADILLLQTDSAADILLLQTYSAADILLLQTYSAADILLLQTYSAARCTVTLVKGNRLNHLKHCHFSITIIVLSESLFTGECKEESVVPADSAVTAAACESEEYIYPSSLSSGSDSSTSQELWGFVDDTDDDDNNLHNGGSSLHDGGSGEETEPSSSCPLSTHSHISTNPSSSCRLSADSHISTNPSSSCQLPAVSSRISKLSLPVSVPAEVEEVDAKPKFLLQGSLLDYKKGRKLVVKDKSLSPCHISQKKSGGLESVPAASCSYKRSPSVSLPSAVTSGKTVIPWLKRPYRLHKDSTSIWMSSPLGGKKSGGRRKKKGASTTLPPVHLTAHANSSGDSAGSSNRKKCTPRSSKAKLSIPLRSKIVVSSSSSSNESSTSARRPHPHSSLYKEASSARKNSPRVGSFRNKSNNSSSAGDAAVQSYNSAASAQSSENVCEGSSHRLGKNKVTKVRKKRSPRTACLPEGSRSKRVRELERVHTLLTSSNALPVTHLHNAELASMFERRSKVNAIKSMRHQLLLSTEDVTSAASESGGAGDGLEKLTGDCTNHSTVDSVSYTTLSSTLSTLPVSSSEDNSDSDGNSLATRRVSGIANVEEKVTNVIPDPIIGHANGIEYRSAKLTVYHKCARGCLLPKKMLMQKQALLSYLTFEQVSLLDKIKCDNQSANTGDPVIKCANILERLAELESQLEYQHHVSGKGKKCNYSTKSEPR
ncbi:hypothetical protein EB796_017864 [Bugula neritina]|uniref:Uncharacterized protein n=1 Tax=Bugula neritina TaxID=10212 RepID=A0A7J7JDY3_BUGNE|nr:hypothetical protein EB796_017864 [Bugula neritina]